MTDYNGILGSGLDLAKRAYIPDQSTNVHSRTYPTDFTLAYLTDQSMTDVSWVSILAGKLTNDWNAQQHLGPPQAFFEMIHYVPQVILLGNILTTVVEEIEIYNSYRDETRTLTDADADAGPGVTFVGLPGLPATILTQSGLIFDVEVTMEGPPSINGTLDFTTDVASFSIIITGSRVIMFAYGPESPIHETLRFKTDIIMAADGSEQRISVRKHPRQSFELLVRVPEDDERQRLITLLKGWHSRVFGVPIWWEARHLGADAISTDTVITVDTDYADFRVGSLAIVWTDSDYFDALEIDSFNSTSITFSSPLTQGFTAKKTLVMPLRVAYANETIGRNSYLKNLQDIPVQFRVIDNEADIADSSAFPLHNSRVLLDEPNLAEGKTVPDALHRTLEQIDNQTAAFIQFSTWDSSHPITRKGFFGNSPQRVWEVRQLAHALRGSQVSFYLPTFYHDLTVVNDLASGSFLMDIEIIGYSDYIQGKEPFKSIWIELVDGTILTRQVTGYTVISSTVERLTVDVSWPSLIVVADISRVSFLRLVRIADDAMEFDHRYPGRATANISIRGTQ